jgi:hypothetical protein
METMITSSHYNDLPDFLAKHYAKNITTTKSKFFGILGKSSRTILRNILL